VASSINLIYNATCYNITLIPRLKPDLSEEKMKSVLRVWLLAILIASPLVCAKTIVTSIKPLQLITLEITRDVMRPELLIRSNASPHDYALKPSDLKKIRDADLVIWFGPALEPFLEKLLEGESNSLELSHSEISIRAYEGDRDSHEEHEGHHHGRYDPHIWLGPKQAEQAARAIYLKLSEIDAPNASTYKENFERFSMTLARTTEELDARFKPYLNSGYYVFHDAYEYFESRFQLNNLGHFTLSPDRKPGAKTLIQIRTALKNGKAKCVFSEPQFKPAIVESVTRGSDVYVGELDPLASDIKVSNGAYFRFLMALQKNYIKCLSY